MCFYVTNNFILGDPNTTILNDLVRPVAYVWMQNSHKVHFLCSVVTELSTKKMVLSWKQEAPTELYV